MLDGILSLLNYLGKDHRTKKEIKKDVFKKIFYLLIVIICLPLISLIGAIFVPIIALYYFGDELITDLKKL